PPLPRGDGHHLAAARDHDRAAVEPRQRGRPALRHAARDGREAVDRGVFDPQARARRALACPPRSRVSLVARADPQVNLATILAITVVAYAALMLAIGWWARGRVDTSEDFLVAGRKLPLVLAAPTLLATWFGAGTLLTATDEVRAGGLRMAALEPLGAGVCLILAGLLLAPKLWRMKLLTLGDFYARRFGVRAERWSAVLMVPSYFGWIAAQYVALAGMLEISFGLPISIGLMLVAAIGIAYTLLGGMWSVTATDALQIALVI